jgi:hypothetical protein
MIPLLTAPPASAKRETAEAARAGACDMPKAFQLRSRFPAAPGVTAETLIERDCATTTKLEGLKSAIK